MAGLKLLISVYRTTPRSDAVRRTNTHGSQDYASSVELGALCRYPERGDLNIDNNLADQMLGFQAIGRRNWTFPGSDRGG